MVLRFSSPHQRQKRIFAVRFSVSSPHPGDHDAVTKSRRSKRSQTKSVRINGSEWACLECTQKKPTSE